MTLPRRVAWIVILIVDAGFILWGGVAALWPQHLPGPGAVPILTAGYEGYTGAALRDLAAMSPKSADFMTMLFRLYGAYCAVFGLLASAIAATAFRRREDWAWWALLVGNTIAFGSAMTYDWKAHAIGPFEVSEYVGIALVYAALAVTASFISTDPTNRSVT